MTKLTLLLIIFCFIFLAFFHTRGVYISDEGYILASAKRLVEGEVPYKDFHFVYTPLSIYFDALALRFFDYSIFGTRLMALFFSFATIIILLKIAQILTSNKLLKYIPVIFFLAWGPSHSNFIFPTQIAIFFALLTCLLFLLNTKKKHNIFAFYAGVATVLTILSKQNFGMALLLTAVIYFIFKAKEKLSYLKLYLIGIVFLSVFAGLFFLLSGSLSDFIHDLYAFSYQHIILKGAFSTSFVYDFSPMGILKFFFYLSPLCFGLLAFKLCFSKNKQFLFLSGFTVLFYIVGIRPTTDYIHLAPLLSITGLAALLVISNIKSFKGKIFIYILISIFIVTGLFTALWKNYYRWDPPLITTNYFENNPLFKIFLLDNTFANISQTINNETNSNDYIFITFYSPIYYFTSDRKNPTMFDLFEEFPFYLQYKKNILEDIDNKKTKLILTKENYKDQFFSGYIKKHYKEVKNANGVVLWKRI